jgi:drug/metabolite transporter (DMT)-like permease
MFIAIALVGYFILAFVNWLDKYVVSVRRSSAVVAVYATVIALPLFIFVPLGAGYLRSSFDYVIAFVSGAAFALALLTMYEGFKETELSHSAPLTGALTTISVAVIGYFILGEVLSGRQWLGVLVLSVAALTFAVQRTRERFVWSNAMLYLLLAGILFGVSHTAAKYLYTEYGFYTGLIWSRAMMGVAGLALLLIPRVRRLVMTSLRKRPQKSSTNSTVIVVGNRCLGVVGILLVQWASALGSVVIVNALQGLQYAVLIVGIIVLGKRAPQRSREFFTVGEFFQEGGALIGMIVGLILVLK